MHDTQSLLAGARDIRPHLDKLLGDEAAQVDAQLAYLLEEAAAGSKVDNLILDLLADHRLTWEWLQTYLDLDQEKLRQAFAKSYDPTPGEPTPIAAEMYVCPVNGDTVWFRQDAGEAIPDCETHHVRLVKV